MSRKFIPVEEAFREWRKDPEYAAEYEALDDEFAVAAALIEARANAAMTQEQVAQAMGTTECGEARVSPARKAGPRLRRRPKTHRNAFPCGNPYDKSLARASEAP